MQPASRVPPRGGHHQAKALARFCSSDRERVSGLFQAERVGGPGGIQATGRLATPAPRRTAWLLKANYTSVIDVTQLLTAYLPPPQLPTHGSRVVRVALWQGPGVQRGWERCRAQPRCSAQGTRGDGGPLSGPPMASLRPLGSSAAPQAWGFFTLLNLLRGGGLNVAPREIIAINTRS